MQHNVLIEREDMMPDGINGVSPFVELVYFTVHSRRLWQWLHTQEAWGGYAVDEANDPKQFAWLTQLLGKFDRFAIDFVDDHKDRVQIRGTAF